jgi:hypothetical protein
MACIEHHKEKKFRFRVRMYIKISQKNKRVLEKLRQELNCGRIRKNRRVYDLDIKNQNHIKEFIKLILPYSRIKKKQLNLGLKILLSQINSKKDLIKVAQLADSLSGHNVRSQTRRKNYASKIQEYFSSND